MGDQAGIQQRILRIELQFPVLQQHLQQGRQVAGIEGAGVLGHRGRQVGGPDQAHAIEQHLRIGLRSGAIAPLGHRQIHHHRTRAQQGQHFARHQHRRRLAGHLGGGDHHIGLLQVRRQQLALGLQEHRSGLAGIAAHFAGGLLQLGRLDEAPPERLHLFPRRRAHITHLHHGAKAARRGHRLQARHAGPEHHHLGGLHGAGRRHQHREEAIQGRRRQQHRLVAGDVGLGGEGIHGLGAADARQQLQSQRRHLPALQLIHQAAVAEGIQQPQ